jgi:hypothetical protein
MKPIRKWLVAGSIIAIFLVTTRVNLRNIKGSGVVLDLASKQPISEVELTLDCRKTKLHGTESIRMARAMSGEEGKYSFNFSDTWDCAYIFVRPNKNGYTNAFGVQDIWKPDMPISATVPSHLWMIRDADVSRLQLEDLLRKSHTIYGRTTPVSDYQAVYSRFHSSKFIAKTTEEVKWVQSNYCNRLTVLWSAIDAKDYPVYKIGPTFSSENDAVKAYCQKVEPREP